MKYSLLLSMFLACTLSFAIEPEQEKVREYQSVLEYCHANPEYKQCKKIKEIFDTVNPSIISRIWRFISGNVMTLPEDQLRFLFLIYCEEIGKELKWNQEKIKKNEMLFTPK
jgi:hypothetical protein